MKKNKLKQKIIKEFIEGNYLESLEDDLESLCLDIFDYDSEDERDYCLKRVDVILNSDSENSMYNNMEETYQKIKDCKSEGCVEFRKYLEEMLCIY